MGIKGRRVHMIEELSETIISFQRGKIRARQHKLAAFLFSNTWFFPNFVFIIFFSTVIGKE